MSFDQYFDANRRNWDERTLIHRKDAQGFYSVETVLAGGDKLNPIEAQEIGDVTGKRIVHLQCHFGLDSLCLTRRGASVVGLDFSPVAIAEARKLAEATGLGCRFVEGNVYEARRLVDGEFDMAYVTWGAINWLPDIHAWAKVVASLLKPGGFLYLLEGHPVTLCLEEKDGELVARFDWRTPRKRPIAEDNPTTYTGDADQIVSTRTYEWIHPLSEVVEALRTAGLAIDFLHEHDTLSWKFFPMMIETDGGRMWRLPDTAPQLPLAFSIKAVKV